MSNSIKYNNSCTGCGVCYTVCQNDAITLMIDEKGFRRPIINSSCIECGLCVKKCHELKTFRGHNVKKAYTAYSKNSQIRNNSSSGGVFSEIATKVINRGGFVCGATFDKNFVLHHQIVEDVEGLEGLRKSKYIESNITQVLKDIKKRVLLHQVGVFVGTPCQCAALRSYLDNNIDNLLICDFICHGVASPVVFEKYKAHLIELYGAPYKIEFRHKEDGNGSFFYYVGEKGKYMIPNYKESYPYAYASGLIIADDCVDCQYCSLERFSDITLGDYVEGNTDYSKSTIFTNTQKGLEILHACKENLIYEEENIQDIINKSWHLTKPNVFNSKREQVFKHLDKSWRYLENKFFKYSVLETYVRALKNKIKNLIKYD